MIDKKDSVKAHLSDAESVEVDLSLDTGDDSWMTAESELSEEEFKARVNSLQSICDIYLECTVPEFIAKAKEKIHLNKGNQLIVELLGVYTYFKYYRAQILALLQMPLKFISEFNSADEYNAYLKEQNNLRQKHFENATQLLGNMSIISERIGFINYLIEEHKSNSAKSATQY